MNTAPLAKRSICFTKATSNQFGHLTTPIVSLISHQLDAPKSIALASLLDTLCCGEESAIIAFTTLAQKNELGTFTQHKLDQIAKDEMRHEHMLWQLRCSLLPSTASAALRKDIKRFYTSLATHDIGLHCAQIAALDSGVCIVLSELRQDNLPIGNQPAINRIFTAIHNDEAHHASITLDLAHALATPGLHAHAAVTIRNKLAQLMETLGEALDILGVDNARLQRRLRSLPAAFLRTQ